MSDEAIQRARILLVDDEPQNVRYLEDVLRWAGFERIESATEAKQALPLFLRFRPDLVVLDLLMPEIDGFGVLESLQEHLSEDDYLPILILTSDASRESRRRALAAGAKDFLTKPMSPTEVSIRVKNLLEARFFHLRCRELEARLDGTADPDEAALDELLEAWSGWADAGSREPGAHARRVAETAAGIGRALGLPEERVRRVRRAALLHDLPVEALASGESGLLRAARAVAASRARSWEDSGNGRGGDGAPPLEARIVAVAHRFDRLRHGKAADGVVDALERLEREAEIRFDPAVVRALASCHAVETG